MFFKFYIMTSSFCLQTIIFCWHLIRQFDNMKLLQVFAVVLLAFGGIAYAGYKTKCDVVRSLRSNIKDPVPDSDIRDCKWN